ncbi:MAG: hypothetical protein ACR2NZ_02920 [Rubripirellula sp.]
MNRVTVFRGSSSSHSSSSVGVSNDMGTDELGTLLWIGDASNHEFSAPRKFCTEQSPQIAIRHSLDDAMQRPAGGVRAILIAESTRRPVTHDVVTQLRLLYPKAAIACLMGAGCEGMHAKELQPALARTERFYCHQWNQFLPSWLAQCGSTTEHHGEECRSVAIVSASMATGETLMELAESVGTTAVWCRDENPCHVRRVDAVWWDDSVARPATAERWRQRIERFASNDFSPQHAWIANLPRPAQRASAEAAGVSLVVSKPYRIDVLVNMLNASTNLGSMATPQLRAA